MQRYIVAELSMAPALLPGDRLLARPARRLRRGDLVVFEHPARPGFDLVKRVVGLPGETLTIDTDVIRIDDRELVEPWKQGSTSGDGTWRIAHDEAFVLSDNRAATRADGRTFGPIPLQHLARVEMRYRPLSRIRMSKMHEERGATR
jgi:signal peptidase I